MELSQLVNIRHRVEGHFRSDTAYQGAMSQIPSAGHCAAVSAIVLLRLGGTLASTTMHGDAHWFNRISDGSQAWDVDLTGDQFGLPPVQVEIAGRLYPNSALHTLGALNRETIERTQRLAFRANMQNVVSVLGDILSNR